MELNFSLLTLWTILASLFSVALYWRKSIAIFIWDLLGCKVSQFLIINRIEKNYFVENVVCRWECGVFDCGDYDDGGGGGGSSDSSDEDDVTESGGGAKENGGGGGGDGGSENFVKKNYISQRS